MDATFFDIGGVILDAESVRDAHERFIADLCEEHDLDVPPEQALKTWRTELGAYFNERQGTEFRAAREGYRRAMAAIAEIPEDEWRPIFERALEKSLKPNPGAVETLDRLAERDLHLGVISDVDTDEGLRILDAFGVREQFDSITTSEMVGKTKPDPAMFETALDGAGVAAGESLMIGDRYRHDIEGAKQAGMQTAAYRAEDGLAVDYRLDDLCDVLDIV